MLGRIRPACAFDDFRDSGLVPIEVQWGGTVLGRGIGIGACFDQRLRNFRRSGKVKRSLSIARLQVWGRSAPGSV